ncbi:MAG: hypothetical protein KDE25_02810 [Novosphingobium sp.]|nr:hypothetical protein [Novosphingobium sp.]
MQNDLSEILDRVVIMLAHGGVKPEAIQKVARAVIENATADERQGFDEQANALLDLYYENLGMAPKGGCTNCGPPGWHAMPTP